MRRLARSVSKDRCSLYRLTTTGSLEGCAHDRGSTPLFYRAPGIVFHFGRGEPDNACMQEGWFEPVDGGFRPAD